MPHAKRLKLALYVAIAAVVLVIIAVVANNASLAVAYHNWCMNRAQQRALADPELHPGGLVSHDVDEDFEQYEYHRDRLVELGALTRVDYEFERVQTSTQWSRDVLELIGARKCPPLADFEATHSPNPEPMTITIWCHPDQVLGWEAFLTAQDH